MNNIRMSTSYIVKISFQHEIRKSRALSLAPVMVASHRDRIGKHIYSLAPAKYHGNILRRESGAGSSHSPNRS